MVACGRCLWASEAVWGQESAERVSERAFLIGIFGSGSNPQNQPNKLRCHATQQGAKKSWKYLCIDFRVWTSPRSNLMMKLAPIPVQYWVNFIFFATGFWHCSSFKIVKHAALVHFRPSDCAGVIWQMRHILERYAASPHFDWTISQLRSLNSQDSHTLCTDM
jgi:hypothetical protein